MKIVSFNVNGIRSALGKGLLNWLTSYNPDIICFQEVKANQGDIGKSLFESMGYHVYWFAAEKKGYSGVAVISKIPFLTVNYGNGHAISDSEGRWLECKTSNFTLINAYFPSGTSGEIRQNYKYQWLDECYNYIDALKNTDPNIILLGDFNIAHKEIDIHNPKTNKNSSGFLPEEREWMTKFLNNGMTDTFRLIHPEAIDMYSWWSYRAAARSKNKGWRIDYITVSENLVPLVTDARILSNIAFSDHSPISIDIDL